MWLGLFLSLAAPGAIKAQNGPEIGVFGQVRPRFEARTPVEGDWSAFTSMRVRAAVEAGFESDLRVVIQFQDVRLFGEETNTLSDYQADNLDLHQGFIELTDIPSVGGRFKVGRQELALGEQRLVGAVNWTQQGRSFDGFRYTTPGARDVKLDLFLMKVREEAASTHEYESTFAGAYGSASLGEAGSLDVFGFLNTDGREDNGSEFTMGGLWRAEAGPVDLRVEGSLQRGQRQGTDVSAFMVGVRAGGDLSETVNATVWFDHLSGDSDPDDDEIGVFNTLFATNHAFYGSADYFLNIPLHTGGLGLQDAAVKFRFALSQATVLRVDLHSFRTAQEGSLSTRALANELDLSLSKPLYGGLGASAGYSFVEARDGIKELGRLDEDAHWVFVMLDASF
jgi:hypothetical protein